MDPSIPVLSLRSAPCSFTDVTCPRATSMKIFVTSLVCMAALGVTQARSTILDRTAQIRALSPSEAALGVPVKLRGVITHYDPGQPDLFIQDSTGGIYVACQKRLTVQQGQYVEVIG